MIMHQIQTNHEYEHVNQVWNLGAQIRGFIRELVRPCHQGMLLWDTNLMVMSFILKLWPKKRCLCLNI